MKISTSVETSSINSKINSPIEGNIISLDNNTQNKYSKGFENKKQTKIVVEMIENNCTSKKISSPNLYFGARKKPLPKPIILKAKSNLEMTNEEINQLKDEEEPPSKVEFKFVRNFEDVKINNEQNSNPEMPSNECANQEIIKKTNHYNNFCEEKIYKKNLKENHDIKLNTNRQIMYYCCSSSNSTKIPNSFCTLF